QARALISNSSPPSDSSALISSSRPQLGSSRGGGVNVLKCPRDRWRRGCAGEFDGIDDFGIGASFESGFATFVQQPVVAKVVPEAWDRILASRGRDLP